MDRLVLLKQFLSEQFQDPALFAEKEKLNYKSALPFPNIVIKNFFNNKFLSKVLEEFPDLTKSKNTQNYKNKNEIKFANNNLNDFPNTIKNFIYFLNSNEFTNFLQIITSIKEKLIVDPGLNGGGLHEIKRGGILKIHTDFNRHPNLNLDRRINVLIYLNKDWYDSYGSHLELWDKKMISCQKKILPSFNTMVIFSTTDFSNHGHPEPLNCPEKISRKSIAMYYFSSGRPKEETIDSNIKNKTYFKNRPGFQNDVLVKKENFKNFIRKFKLYKILKDFEKKYLRKEK